MKRVLFCIIIFTLSVIGVFGQTSSEKVQMAAEEFVSDYNAKNYAAIEARFDAQMKATISGDKLKELLDGLHRDLGKIVKLNTPKFIAQTVADFPVDFESGSKMTLLIALNEEGKIGGLRVSPLQPQKPKTASRNRTKFILPFTGEWFVFWGGDTTEQNYHQAAPDQRFAFDLVKTDEKGKTHTGDGKANEHYYVFSQPIQAPAAGVVTYVVDGVHDNKPGEMNRMFVPGNMVIIKHSENEYSLMAHFKQNSIKVKVGDKVTQGQHLGLCGNSGNSSEPHLHFQVQTGPFFENESTMKVFFEKVVVRRDGKTETKTDYSPVKGDVISQP